MQKIPNMLRSLRVTAIRFSSDVPRSPPPAASQVTDKSISLWKTVGGMVVIGVGFAIFLEVQRQTAEKHMDEFMQTGFKSMIRGLAQIPRVREVWRDYRFEQVELEATMIQNSRKRNPDHIAKNQLEWDRTRRIQILWGFDRVIPEESNNPQKHHFIISMVLRPNGWEREALALGKHSNLSENAMERIEGQVYPYEFGQDMDVRPRIVKFDENEQRWFQRLMHDTAGDSIA